MPDDKPTILYGWKDICAYLGHCSVLTAQRRAKRVGIVFERSYPVLDTELYEKRVKMKSLGLLDKHGNTIAKTRRSNNE